MKKVIFILTITLSMVLAGLSNAQQTAKQKPSGGEEPKSTYRKAMLDFETKKVVCPEEGHTCRIVDLLLVSPTRPMPFYDGLQDVTQQLNGIIAEIRARNQDPKRELVVILTPYAPFLAWCYPGAEIKKPVSLEENPRLFYEALGITGSVEKMKEASGGKTRNYIFEGGTFICYPSPKEKQLVPNFVEAMKATPSHDEVLQSATRRINALLRQAAARGSKGKELSLMVTPVGLLLAWSRNEGRGYVPPRGAITGDAPAEQIIKALALPVP